MKKRLAALILTVCMVAAYIPAFASSLPAALNEIGDGAFRGDGSVTGVISLPAGVARVGEHAFTGTGVYALIVPEGTAQVGAQAFGHAAYVRVNGAATQVGALSGVRCVLASAGSPALAAASGADAVPLEELAVQEGFLYRVQGGSVTLLCAGDPAVVGMSVVIPETVGGKPVTAISGYAFIGCTSLTAIRLPAAVKASVTPGATADCPAAVITYAVDEGGDEAPEEVIVRSVTADVTAGASGNSITWNVDAQGAEGASFAYTVERNGAVILEAESGEATFTCEAGEAGAYRLFVTVTGRGGAVATGASAVLYIAVEAMVMTVPESIAAGADLVINVGAVENAQGYTLYVTDEQTGALVKKLTPAKAGNVTVDGYLLSPGEYRVSGYVHGNDFRYTVPTVRNVTVTGTLADGPVIPAQAPLLVNNACFIDLEGDAAFVIRHQLRRADGTLSDHTYARSEASGTAGIYSYIYAAGYQGGGAILVQAALLVDGKWTAWGPVTEIPLTARPTLAKPVLTFPATVAAGADFTISFTAVENGAEYYVSIFSGYTEGEVNFPENRLVWGSEYNPSGNTVYVSGSSHSIPAGEYTVVVEVMNHAGGFDAAVSTAKLTVTGTRPQASVAVSADAAFLPRDQSNWVDVTVTAPGAESAAVSVYEVTGDGRRTHHDGQTVQLDSSGVGYGSLHTYIGNPAVTACEFTACVLVDGVWSERATYVVPVGTPAPLEPAVITVPETLANGADLTFSFAAVEGAEAYEAIVYSTVGSNGGPFWAAYNVQPGQTITMPGYKLNAGTYYIEVKATSGTRDTSTAKVYFTVTGTKPAAPAVTCDSDVAYVGAKVKFTVDALDAQDVYCDWTGTGSSSGTVPGSGASWQYNFSASHVGKTMIFRFTVKQDGLWSQWATITFDVLEARPLDKPAITCPEAVQAGADVVFSFGAVQNAERYSVVLRRPDGSTRTWTGYPGNETTLAGYDLLPGVYTLEVKASGAGYDSSTAVHTLTVTGTRADAPAVMADKTAVFEGEKYTFAIGNGACELIAWKYTTDAGGSNSGTLNVLVDVTVWETSASWAGVQTYSFCTLKDGVWSAWSEPVAVTISQRPAMPAPVVNLPDTAQKGVDLIFTVAPVEGASYYYAELYTIYGQRLESRYMPQPGSVTVLGCSLPDSYVRVQVTAYGENGGRSQTSKTLRVVSAVLPAAPAVTGPSGGVVESGTGASFTVDFSGAAAQRVAVRYYRVGDPNNVTITAFDVTGDAASWRAYSRETGTTWAYAFSVLVDGVWSAWSSELRVETVD